VREFEASIDQRRVEFLLRATRELKLTADQRGQIDKIVLESQERTRQVWEQVAPQMRKELADTKDKIHVMLTPEQQARFEELLKQPPRGRRPEDPEKSDRRGRGQSRPFPPDEGLPRTNPPQSPLPVNP
jgi:Spy/CpxP family protein refolding chaperone